MADSQTPVSPVADNKPELTFSAATIEVNREPVELDGTPASQDHLRQAGRRGSKADALEGLSAEERMVRSLTWHYAELKGISNADVSAFVHQERENMMKKKSKDPAVLVSVVPASTSQLQNAC